MTMELDIDRLLAHLKWVGEKAVKVQRRYTVGYTTEMAWRLVRQHSIYLHRVRRSITPFSTAEGEDQSSEDCQWR